MILTYRYRVKSLIGRLEAQSKAVNTVWNYCNDRQKDAIKWNKKWLTGFDLITLTTGSGKYLGLHSSTVQAVCQQYAKSRQQNRRPCLRYRGSKSLGWVPLSGRDIKRQGDAFLFHSRLFRVFNSRQLPDGTIKDGTCFASDSRGRWYLNIVIDVAEGSPREPCRQVGIDLGVNDFATLSTGEKITNPRYYRTLENKISKAHRARKKRLAGTLYAKATNARRDYLHKLSARIIREFDYIAVGNVSAAGIAKTSMAKSVLDAGWSSFRRMLAYKSIRNGATYEEVSEYLSTQICSACGCVSGPKGRAGLSERKWKCGECGCDHDRDLNAAVNLLLRSGHRTPAQGAQFLGNAKDVF